MSCHSLLIAALPGGRVQDQRRAAGVDGSDRILPAMVKGGSVSTLRTILAYRLLSSIAGRASLTKALLGLLICITNAKGESAPTLLNFQGRLSSPGGAPVTAPQSVRFTLIQGGTASESPSTGLLVYQEDATATPDANGVFAHVIGSGVPVAGQTLTEADFITNGVPLFIEMKVGAETLLPRTRLLSAAYAIEASRLDGKSSAEIIGQAGGNAWANEVVRKGAVLEWISGTQVRIRPGTLGFSDGKVRRTTTYLTWDATKPNGPLGLDSGSLAADTFYYLYAVPDPLIDAQFTALASVAAPQEVGGSGPTGYATYRFLGSFRTDSALAVLQFYRSGKSVDWQGNVASWLLPSASCVGPQPADSVNQWKTVDASAYMPLTARVVHVTGYYDNYGSGGMRFFIAPKGGEISKELCNEWGDGGTHFDTTTSTFNRSFIYYALLARGSNDANQCTAFYYAGYEEDLSEY